MHVVLCYTPSHTTRVVRNKLVVRTLENQLQFFTVAVFRLELVKLNEV